MREPTRIPLALIQVRCSVCGEEVRTIEVNRDKARFHSDGGAMIRFPREGLTEAETAELNTTFLLDGEAVGDTLASARRLRMFT